MRTAPVAPALALALAVGGCAGIFQDNLDAILADKTTPEQRRAMAEMRAESEAELDSWRYDRSTDPLTDRVYTAALKHERWGQVSIQCSEDELWAVVWSESTIHGGDRIRVRYRVDERPAVPGEWKWDRWDTATTRTLGDAHRFARSVASAVDRVVLRLEGDVGAATTLVFPVVRVAETIDRVLADCGLR